MERQSIPLWLKISYTALALTVLVVYSIEKPTTNFLWYSDIALFVLVAALWLENRLLNSVMAVGVLFLEIGWVVDFVTLGNLIGVTEYMFDGERVWYTRLLSGVFHLVLPPVMIYLLIKLGYDLRALRWQIIMTAVVLPLTYLTSDPDNNINWVFGPIEPQDMIHPWLYLLLLFAAMCTFIFVPSHYILKRWYAGRRRLGHQLLRS